MRSASRLAPRDTPLRVWLPRQAEQPLRDLVAQHLRRAALDRVGACAQEVVCSRRREAVPRHPGDTAEPRGIDSCLGATLVELGVEDLADAAFGAWGSSCGARSCRAERGDFFDLLLDVDLSEAV